MGVASAGQGGGGGGRGSAAERESKRDQKRVTWPWKKKACVPRSGEGQGGGEGGGGTKESGQEQNRMCRPAEAVLGGRAGGGGGEGSGIHQGLHFRNGAEMVLGGKGVQYPARQEVHRATPRTTGRHLMHTTCAGWLSYTWSWCPHGLARALTLTNRAAGRAAGLQANCASAARCEWLRPSCVLWPVLALCHCHAAAHRLQLGNAARATLALPHAGISSRVLVTRAME